MYQINSMSSQIQVNGLLFRWTLAGLTALLLVGCERDDTKVYRIAKSDATASATPAAPAMAPSDMTTPPPGMNAPATGDQSGAPQLKWTLPDGWQEKPASGMRLATFSALGKDGQMVDVSIVPLPGMAGGDLSNVNRWRGQVGLDAIQEDDLSKLGEDVIVGDATAKLFDLAGTPAGAAAKSRILAVALHREDMMWFFKATGDDDSVGLQKANFISFLKSVQFATADNAMAALPADHPPMDATTPAPAAPGMAGAPAALPTWTVPAAWQSQPPTTMLLAVFSATENGKSAEITVSSFPGDMGGLLANVNRWRGQVSLPAVDDAGLPAAATPLDTAAGPASLTDFTGTDSKTGQPTRLVGLILPLNGQTWFYKLKGDATVVEHQKADFIKFVQSVKY